MSDTENKLPTPKAGHWDRLLQDEFNKESDRACVILGAALLDSALETLLKTRLAPITGSHDSLLDGSTAPISSFSARIDLAYRIGLISPKFARDLHLIRKVRNDFAHNITGCSFADSAVQNRVMELTRSHGILDRKPEWAEDSPKGEFKLAVSWMQWYLRGITERITAIQSPNLEWGYHAKFEDNKNA